MQRMAGIPLSSLEHLDPLSSLQKALKSLESFGNNTRIGIRCHKYLDKLVQIAVVTGTLGHHNHSKV